MIPIPPMRYSIVCALLVVSVCAASPAFATGPPSPDEAAGPVVSAFYYPWFANTVSDGSYAHWGQDGHSPPNDIASVYYPALGVYSSDDPTVLGNQMSEIGRAGIDQIAVSWWGKGSAEDSRLPGVVAAANAHGISVAVHIEPYAGRTVASVGADIAYLETLGIRTFYIYQAFVLPAASWAPLNDMLRSEGLTVFGQTALVGQAVAGHFSGIYTYDIVTWTAGKFARLCAEAHAHDLLCAPSVGPGYDARRATGDPHVKPRLRGLTYDSMWRAAIAARADIVSITSFNEWQEGTQIEPAAPRAVHGSFAYVSYDGAWGLGGVAAEAAYLDRTAHWAALFRELRQPRPYPRPT
jgi:glycoprotein endo-alpha-1,2-mannosidase